MQNKLKPMSPTKVLTPYLVYNLVTTTLILVASVSVFLVNTDLAVLDSILLFFTLLFLSYIHIICSAEIDFLHPRDLKSQANVNQNEVKSSILTFAISLIFFGVLFFFLLDGLNGVYLKLFCVVTLVLILRCWLFHYKARVLFKEI